MIHKITTIMCAAILVACNNINGELVETSSTFDPTSPSFYSQVEKDSIESLRKNFIQKVRKDLDTLNLTEEEKNVHIEMYIEYKKKQIDTLRSLLQSIDPSLSEDKLKFKHDSLMKRFDMENKFPSFEYKKRLRLLKKEEIKTRTNSLK